MTADTEAADGMERFFISGCQRSGTTMLRLALESHPDVHCFDEIVGNDILVREAKGEKAEFTVKEGATRIGFKIPRFAEQMAWPQFNEYDYGVFPSFYKGQKVIHIVRDALDVIGSMMRLKDEGSMSWIEKYGRAILKFMVANPNIRPLYKRKYEELERLNLPVHLVGALYWEIKNQGLFDLLEQGKPAYAVKYESLVAEPKSELLKLARFLGLSWSDSLLNHPEHPHAELYGEGLAIGLTDPRRPIDMQSVGSYRQFMTEAQVRDVRDYVEGFPDKIVSAMAS